MKAITTPTLKLTQLPNGGLEIVKNRKAERISHLKLEDAEPLSLDEREAKALKDFLNECHPTTNLA